MKPSLFFLSLCLLLAGCADVEPVKECLTGHEYGFWAGIWHGWIAPIAFIGSLFSDDIAVFAVNNTGGWYVFGFLLGIGAFSGSAAKIADR